ncbi:hypothetical protein ACE1SV_10920 [Streptomyces sennicomposti]
MGVAAALDGGERAEPPLAEQAGEGFVGQWAGCWSLSHDVLNVRARSAISRTRAQDRLHDGPRLPKSAPDGREEHRREAGRRAPAPHGTVRPVQGPPGRALVPQGLGGPPDAPARRGGPSAPQRTTVVA